MLLPVIPTDNQKLLLKFDLRFDRPGTAYIKGFDGDTGKTIYFNREARVDFPGVYTFDFPMPLTPKNLRVRFEGQDYGIQSISCEYLKPRALALWPEDIQVIKFFEWFAVNASTLAVGSYRWPKLKYWINYMNDIVDDTEGKLDTPSRIDHHTFEIQVSRNQMKNFTVPIIMAILCHEYTHGKYDTKDETLCDLESCRICLGLGYPKSEIIYAFANIFHDSATNINRINKVMNYVNKF